MQIPKELYIECPECENQKNLSLHISVCYASIRIPVIKGKPSPAYEILRDKPIPSDEVFLRFSDVTGQTRISLHKDEINILVHCPKCKKMHNLSKGIIKCSDAEQSSVLKV